MIPIDERSPVDKENLNIPCGQATMSSFSDVPLRRLSPHSPGKRKSSHTLMYESELLKSSVAILPLIRGSFADSVSSSKEEVFPVVYPICQEEIEFHEHSNALKNESTIVNDPLSMSEFLIRNRPLLPPGVRAEFRRMIFVQDNAMANNAHIPNMSTRSVREIRPFLEEKEAIESLNPWFQYDKIFHQCRTEYNFHHRSIDLLVTQALNKDQLRELLVVLYGQHYMIHAPDLYCQWIDFITGFWHEHQHHVDQLWIDLQKLNDAYGNKQEPFVVQRSSSIGSLSTTRQSNISATTTNPMYSELSLIEL